MREEQNSLTYDKDLVEALGASHPRWARSDTLKLPRNITVPPLRLTGLPQMPWFNLHKLRIHECFQSSVGKHLQSQGKGSWIPEAAWEFVRKRKWITRTFLGSGDDSVGKVLAVSTFRPESESNLQIHKKKKRKKRNRHCRVYYNPNAEELGTDNPGLTGQQPSLIEG